MSWWSKKPEPPKPTAKLADLVTERLMDRLDEFPPLAVMHAMYMCLDELEAAEPNISEVVVAKCAVAFATLFDQIPTKVTKLELQEALETRDPFVRVPTIALYDMLTNCGMGIMDLCGTFFHRELREENLFRDLRTQLRKNEARASGFDSPHDPKLKIISADEMVAPPYDLVEMYCAHTPFYNFLTARVPLEINPRTIPNAHTVIIAESGWGKSQLTGLLLRQALEDTQDRAIILCDPHGDLYDDALPHIPKDRLLTIDLTTNPPDLNILDKSVLSDRAALETFRFLISSLATGLTPKQENCIKPLFALLNEIPDANLKTLHEIVTEQAKRPTKFAEPISRLNDIHRTFFQNLWYSSFGDTRDALQWKISAALDDPVFFKMFTAKSNALAVSRWIDDKRVVLVKSADTLDREGARLFFLFLVGQFYAAAKRRHNIPNDQRHVAQMFFDEAALIMQSSVISDIFTETRKYNCFLTVATQLWHQIGEDVRPAVLGSTGVRIIGQLQLNEGKAVGPDMGLTAEQIKTLRNYPRSHAEWYIYIRSVFDKARRMSAPYGALASMPKPKAEPAQTLEPPPEPKQPPPEFDQLNNPKTGWDIMQERADKAIADNNKSEPPDAPPQAHLSPVQQERVPPTRERPSPAPQTITHLDANARIDKALRLLTSALRPVVENQLRRVHGAHWRQHVSVAAGSDPNDPLDPYAALKTVLDNWQSSFKDSFKVKTRTDVSRAYDARNAIAHAVDELPPADAISYLTAIRDIAIAISADAVTNTVKTFIADQLAAAAGGSTKSAQMRPDEPLLKPGKDW